jgi:hypothetical protein
MDIVNITEWNAKIEEAFARAKESIPGYEQELKIINTVLTKGLNVEERLALEKRQKELSELIDDLLNDTSLGFYIIETQRYLTEYIETSTSTESASVSFMKKDRVGNPKLLDLTKSFLEIVKKYNDILKLELPTISTEKKVSIVCHCGNNKDFDIVDKRVYYCLKCGTQIKENIGSRSTYKDTERVNISGKYKYTRMIHFKNCLRQYQGKQKARIPPECIRDVNGQLHINGINVKSKKTNPQHIRTALQETGWSDQYENFVLIWSMITERSCPDVSQLEDMVIQDFQLVERAYNEVIGDPKEERSSFMSYPYVLYQLLLRRGWKCDLNFFNMLKPDRIVWLDEIMEQIYFKLEWGGFVPLA